MSDYHVLDGTENGHAFQVAMHFPVPDANNAAGIAYRTCAAAQAVTSSMVPANLLAAGESEALASGLLVEVAEVYRTHPGHPDASDRLRLDALYSTTKTITTADLQRRWRYFGFSRDVG